MVCSGDRINEGKNMDSILDSVTWDDAAQAGGKARRPRRVWLKRALFLVCAVAALGVLLSP